MNTVTRSVKSRFAHKILAAAVLLAGLGGVALSSTPALAHDGWQGERWRAQEWREHEWREHHGWYRPYYGYYAPAPRYYAPPAVVYAPPPPPASFNVVIPFR